MDKFELITENVSDVVWISDLSLNLTYISPSVKKLTGYTPEEYIGKPLFEKYPPASLDIINRVYSEELLIDKDPSCEKKRNRILEVEHYHKDGSLICISINISFIRDDKGIAQGFLGISRDISDIKSALKALSHSNELMNYIIEHNRSSVAVHDRELKYLYVSKRYLEEYNVKEKDIIGRHHYDLFPDLPQKWREVNKRALNGEVISAEDDPYPRSDGSVEWTRWECRPWYESNDQIGGIIVYTEIITEKKKIENKLKQSEEHYRRLYETMSQGIIYQDPQGEILSANPAAEKIVGASSKDSLFSFFPYEKWDFITDEDKKIPVAKFPPILALKTGKAIGPKVIGIINQTTKQRVWLSVHSVPLIKKGTSTPFQVYSIFEDITAKRKADLDYRSLFGEMLDAAAVHEIICDDKGQVVDYKFLDVNPSFEKMTGLIRENIINRTVLDVMPQTEPYWIDKYSHVALTGLAIKFEDYSQTFDKYFEVSAYRNAPNQFTCIFSDITEQKRAREAISAERDKAKMYLDTANVMLLALDMNGSITLCNKKASLILGYDQDELIGMNWFLHFIKASDKTRLIDIFNRMIGGEFERFEYHVNPIITRYGHERIISWNNRLIYDDSENICGILFSGIDITEQKKTQDALKESEDKYSSYINNSPDGVLVLDNKANFVEVNQAASHTTGYSKEELLHMSVSDLAAFEDKEYATTSFQELADKGSIHKVMRYRRKDGTYKWWILNAVKLRDDRFIGFTKDITSIKEAESNLYYLSYHDQLTGVYNRRFFEEELQRLDTKRNLPISVIMGDVNGLKLVNDSFGHAKGDDLLIKAAELLKNTCRADDIIARYGGDEFIMILPKTDKDEASRIINRIKTTASSIKVSNVELSISYGHAVKEDTDTRISEILSEAENMMYRQKLYERTSVKSKTVDIIMNTLFEKSSRESLHSKRVSALSRTIAKKMGLNTDLIMRISVAGLVHDIGKIGINENILNKAGSLDPKEWDIMKKHPEIGWRILSSTTEFSDIARFVLEHQEQWNGEGYPKGLEQEEISLEARIIGIADAYDAMTRDRSYRKGLSIKEAAEELKRCSGTQFDPAIVEVLVSKILKK